MTQVFPAQDVVISRISEIVDRLFQENEKFRERLEKDEVMSIFSNLLAQVDTQELCAVDESELTDRVERVMVREAVAGTLNELTPEQMAIFDAAVEGKW
ncbi:hypothetical protein PJF56_05495 [Roseofilum sp. BLCC_M91]|uniref:Uncharacterized protein n=1 Tax=Roseofilum halophilum BLCC-M91 TaxID=3022259 RepID=A0ABT7BI89_9CYAN|nr:hypothetical protein [Roseofilum halophilum]MDJ1178309.1 hypothetical protein [Roseofilum halophilum BLCC-M91]